MSKLLHILLLLSLITDIAIGQVYNHEITYDLNEDGKLEKLLFIDEFEKEFNNDQFSKVQILFGLDTFELENRGIWVTKNYNQSYVYKNLDNRIGVLKDHHSTFLWLTGFQYGCCLNKTTFLKVINNEVHSIFQRDFEVDSIFHEGDRLYFLGSPHLTEGAYGEYSSKGFAVNKYAPIHVYSLSDEVKYDSALTYKYNRLYYSIYDKDVFKTNDSYTVYFSFNSDLVLINKFTLNYLKHRDFGVLSLTVVNDKYLNKYSEREWRLMRNELFAYYGYIFKSDELTTHFSKKNWYRPRYADSDKVYFMMTDIEKKNITLIINKENGS